VLLIGDSFFGSSHQITAYLEGLAREADALAESGRYRDNSRLTANALADSGIAAQYASALAEGEVKVVIMNGGGADLLINPCATADASCPAVVAAAAAAADLLAQMAADGVGQVVYVFYPDPVEAGLRAKIDALRPLIEGACTNSALTCHFLDLRPTFAGHYEEYIQVDGMNPTEAGAQASAQAIWGVMQKECIAQ
jgi:lysophospholipase L1-like esterase